MCHVEAAAERGVKEEVKDRDGESHMHAVHFDAHAVRYRQVIQQQTSLRLRGCNVASKGYLHAAACDPGTRPCTSPPPIPHGQYL